MSRRMCVDNLRSFGKFGKYIPRSSYRSKIDDTILLIEFKINTWHDTMTRICEKIKCYVAVSLVLCFSLYIYDEIAVMRFELVSVIRPRIEERDSTFGMFDHLVRAFSMPHYQASILISRNLLNVQRVDLKRALYIRHIRVNIPEGNAISIRISRSEISSLVSIDFTYI